MTQDTDHALMQRIAQRDSAAYRQLVGRHANRCLRVAERMLGSRADAEDITQEACLKIWREAPRWQPQAKFSTWLYRVVLNACMDHRRKVVPITGLDMDGIAAEQPDEEHTQQRRQVRAALARLPERQRAALVLSYYEGLSNQESAATLGVSLGAFQQLLLRARHALKQELLPQKEIGHG